jgi:hypothetical protein
MIQISHECPLELLEDSKQFNDYDYGLVHLYDEVPEYKQYYIDAVKAGRNVLLDNSIFELEEAFDAELFAQAVRETKPTQYIIPDVLDDADATINNWKNFVENYSDLEGIRIGVVQGETYEDFKRCYEFMSKHADKIAISYNTKCFEEDDSEIGKEAESYNEDKLAQFYRGRPRLIKKLQNDGVWNFDKPHHLLGCSFYKEFTENKELYENSNVESLDTSNPVIAGIKDIKYDGINGIDSKPTIKVCDLINLKLTEEQKELINYNTTQFREGLK